MEILLTSLEWIVGPLASPVEDVAGHYPNSILSLSRLNNSRDLAIVIPLMHE